MATEPTVIRITRLGWCGLAIVLLAPWAIVLRQRPAAKSTPVASSAPNTESSPAARNARAGKLKPGPWGDIEFNTVMIEPPESFIVVPPADRPPRWTFKGYSSAALENLWLEAGLTAAEREALVKKTAPGNGADELVVSPSLELVANLTPTAREKIYTVLGRFPENPSQFDPYRFRADSADDWLQDASLPAEILALTRRLMYRRNQVVLFSDEDVVLPQLPTAADRIRFLKAVSRKSALMMQLRITADTDTDGLTRYWGQGRRAKDIEPLLVSMARRPGGGTLDIVHLLPSFARSLLYTFPLPTIRPDDAARDCHWTTFNFANDVPDDRFTSIDFVKHTLETDYYPVAGEPMFGDVILLLRPGGVVIHSCVFVADDVVFTKNGPGYSVPWVLARLENVVSFYGRGEELETRRYRSKER
jgi:hypothetical protein